MGEKAKVKETVRLYSKVWQLPTFRGIGIRIFVYTLVFSFLMGALRGFSNSLSIIDTFIEYFLILVAPAVVGLALLYLIIRQKGSPLDARRTSGVVQYGILLWFSFGFVGSLIDFLLSSTFFEIRMMLLGMAAAYTLASFLVTGLSDRHPLRNFLAASMLPITWILRYLLAQYLGFSVPFLPINWPIIVVAMLIIASLAVQYIFNAVSVPFERDLGINGPALLRAFGHDYLCENPEPFENLITQIASEQDIPLDVIVFKNGDELTGMMVTLYVHPGPFRNLGSSGLPSAIIEYVREKYNVPTLVLHGTCTHHQNLTNKEDYVKIMNELDRLIEETVVHDKIAGPHWTDNGKFKAWTFFVENNVLLVTTSAPDFTDDIALDVGQQAKEAIKAENPSISGISIADAHNCINDDAVSVMPDDPEATEYIDTVKKAFSTNMGSSSSLVSIGMHQVVLDDFTSKEGMGPGGVTALVLKTEKEESVLISVDGNNMEPGMREEIQELLRGKGFANIEATTTDTHLVNAISMSSKGYPPIGRYRRNETLLAILKAANEAKANVEPAQVGMGFGGMTGLRTFGEKGFDTLTQVIVESFEIAKRLGLRVGGLMFFAALLLAFLL